LINQLVEERGGYVALEEKDTHQRHATTALPAMTAALSRSEAWSLLALNFLCFGIIANTFQGDGEPLIVCLAFSGLAYSATYALIRWLGPKFISAGLKGKDMSKASKKEMYGSLQH
jgi:hypothetical protein